MPALSAERRQIVQRLWKELRLGDELAAFHFGEIIGEHKLPVDAV
jgi:hypothetical protein